MGISIKYSVNIFSSKVNCRDKKKGNRGELHNQIQHRGYREGLPEVPGGAVTNDFIPPFEAARLPKLLPQLPFSIYC